jgi:hypothetical protein
MNAADAGIQSSFVFFNCFPPQLDPRLQNFAFTTLGTFVFPSGPRTTIEGNVFNDANGNGQLDASENGLANIPVYIDLNHNGVYHAATEPQTPTQFFGDYKFDHAPHESLTIRQVLPDHWIQRCRATTPEL